MEELISLSGLNIWYDREKPVISGLSLELGKNSVVGLIGLNGAGKTTLMNTVCGLHTGFTLDEFRFMGKKSAFRDNEFKTSRYMVFSEDESFGYLTFDEYADHVFRCYGKKPDPALIDGLSESFGFGEYRNVLIKNLSLGNRRKAYLITAFALKPPLLMLDEPVNGLDFTSTEALYRLIADYREYGTVLFSSHILESITLTSDRVLVLEEGHIVKSYEGSGITPERIRASLDCGNGGGGDV